MRTHPTHDSIFGDTVHGVPNPMVPHQHPYPTRYHGPIYPQPQATLPYVMRPYAIAPYAGLGAWGARRPLGQSGETGATVHRGWMYATVGLGVLLLAQLVK